jgi:hypothetical protein
MKKRATIALIAALPLLLAIVSLGRNRARDAVDERDYHSVVPLGAERIDLKPSKRDMYILATAESPYFEGWHGRADEHFLLSADGSKVKYYPRRIDFRLTATAMRPDLLSIDSFGTLHLTEPEVNDYLLHLGFRIIVFHGLQMTRIEPDSVRLLGMPADVPYDERIFRTSFNLPYPVPIDDRIVLEVLSPSGDRLCKFHLDLF